MIVSDYYIIFLIVIFSISDTLTLFVGLKQQGNETYIRKTLIQSLFAGSLIAGFMSYLFYENPYDNLWKLSQFLLLVYIAAYILDLFNVRLRSGNVLSRYFLLAGFIVAVFVVEVSGIPIAWAIVLYLLSMIFVYHFFRLHAGFLTLWGRLLVLLCWFLPFAFKMLDSFNPMYSLYYFTFIMAVLRFLQLLGTIKPRHLMSVGDKNLLLVDEHERSAVYDSILENTPNSIILTNLEGKIIYMNPATETMTGYSEKEVLGSNPRIFQSGETSLAAYQNLWNTILDGKVWRNVIKNRKKSGELYWEDLTIVPIKNDRGKVTYFLAVKMDNSDAMEKRNKLENEAKYDDLTGVLRRSYFERLVAIQLKQESDYLPYLIMIDVNDFKMVNDRMGHAMGDNVLAKIAYIIRTAFGKNGIVCRHGGDEFLVLAHDISLENIQLIMNSIHRQVRSLSMLEDNKEIRVSLSFGITEIKGTLRDSIVEADMLMYDHKGKKDT